MDANHKRSDTEFAPERKVMARNLGYACYDAFDEKINLPRPDMGKDELLVHFHDSPFWTTHAFMGGPDGEAEVFHPADRGPALSVCGIWIPDVAEYVSASLCMSLASLARLCPDCTGVGEGLIGVKPHGMTMAGEIKPDEISDERYARMQRHPDEQLAELMAEVEMVKNDPEFLRGVADALDGVYKPKDDQ